MGRPGRRTAAAAVALAALGCLGPADARAEEPELRLEGFVGFDYRQYFLEREGTVPAVVQVQVAPRLRAKWRFVRAAAELEFRHDFLDAGRGPRWILREAVVGLRHQGFRLEGGALLERWGKMDIASPTDTLTVPDMEELFFPEPLPVPGVLVGYASGVFSIKGVFVPAFVPARLRNSAPSRWDVGRTLPAKQVVPGSGIIGDLVFDADYAVFEEGIVTGAGSPADGFEGGMRVDLFLNAVDLGLSFSTVHDRLPSWTTFRALNDRNLNGDPEHLPDHLETRRVELGITPHHQRLWVPGLDLAVNAGPLVLKGEAAFYLTEDMQHASCLTDDPYVKYAAGVELVLQNLGYGFDLAVRAQYNGDVELAREGDEVVNQDEICTITTKPGGGADPSQTDYATGFQGDARIRHPNTHAFYWNVNLGFTDRLALDLRGMVDVAGDVIFTGRLAYQFVDRLEGSVGWLVLRGAEGTIFEPYGDNHRLELGLRYRF